MTMAMISACAEVRRFFIHVPWGETKVTGYTLEDAVSSLCLYVDGDRSVFADDPRTKSATAQTKAVRTRMHPEVLLKAIAKTMSLPSVSGPSGMVLRRRRPGSGFG